MGNDCKGCDKRSPELELIICERPLNFNYINDRNELIKSKKKEPKYATFKEIVNSDPEMYRKLTVIKNALITAQERRLFKNNLKKNRASQKLFKTSEIYETLSPQTLLKDAKIEKNKKYTYKSGAEYEGEWLGGLRHGKGTMKWTDGIVYEGEWSYGFAEGAGRILYPDGASLTGTFLSSRVSGFGVLENPNIGYEYSGFWRNDLQNGAGRENWADGSTYEGNFVDGKKNGLGRYSLDDGTVYFGQWRENKNDGLGLYVWSDGRIYGGGWKEGKMDGFGIYVWLKEESSDLENMHGEDMNRRRNNGQNYYKKKEDINGKNGENYVILNEEKGKKYKKYVGEYVEDKKHGFGVYEDSIGKYEGFWERGEQCGVGRVWERSGKVKIGVWQNNKFIKTVENADEFNMKSSEIEANVAKNNKKAIENINKLVEILDIELTDPAFKIETYCN